MRGGGSELHHPDAAGAAALTMPDATLAEVDLIS